MFSCISTTHFFTGGPLFGEASQTTRQLGSDIQLLCAELLPTNWYFFPFAHFQVCQETKVKHLEFFSSTETHILPCPKKAKECSPSKWGFKKKRMKETDNKPDILLNDSTISKQVFLSSFVQRLEGNSFLPGCFCLKFTKSKGISQHHFWTVSIAMGYQCGVPFACWSTHLLFQVG